MSMLAERKRKQKWILNPKNNDWSSDSNKFGQKLLEKMGWSLGKGLGAKEDGITEHIKVSYKHDSKGMGFKETDDQWTEHESNFTNLLSNLSKNSANIEIDKETEHKVESLEEKSQSSRVRVHYHKFTRGKDLSRYSEKDLANIFGRKTMEELKKPKIEQEPNHGNSNSKTYGVETLNGGSMIDYFKKKLPTSKKYVVNGDSASDDERPSFGLGFGGNKSENNLQINFMSFMQNGENDSKRDNVKKLKAEDELKVEFTPLKKKFKNFESLNSLNDKTNIIQTPKKMKKDISEINDLNELDCGITNAAFDPMFNAISIDKKALDVIQEEDENNVELEESDKLSKKSRKLKKIKIQQTESDNNSLEITDETVNAEVPIKSKKKKNKKRKNEEGIENLCFEDNKDNNSSFKTPEELSQIDQDLSCEPIKKKKKKSKKNKEENSEDSSRTETFNGNEKIDELHVKKKKNKVKNEGVVNPCFEDNLSLPVIERRKIKKKDKKKNNLEELSIINCKNNNSHEGNSAILEIKVSKNKKRKIDELTVLDNPCFNPVDSSEINDELTSSYEVKRKKKKIKLGIENQGLDLTISPNDKMKKTNDNYIELEMPKLDDEIMLNIVNTPILKKETDISSKRINKSVRFSEINESIFINKTDSPADLRRNGIENQGYDVLANNLEENINSLNRKLDNYQAEIENDINEAKIVMVGEMGDPNGENQILPDGDVKLKFKHAKFGRIPSWLKKNDVIYAKKSYRHLIKGDIVMGFKNTNLHLINGYGKSETPS